MMTRAADRWLRPAEIAITDVQRRVARCGGKKTRGLRNIGTMTEGSELRASKEEAAGKEIDGNAVKYKDREEKGYRLLFDPAIGKRETHTHTHNWYRRWRFGQTCELPVAGNLNCES
ncbi:hypothetical protein HPP92_010573 [Vanilla planifolia]|uniref:Uncharacterized protein n=1 Tax=Vanilla planifolia TaxID=51239 RepID=A0A835R152_VANPL|nr:hypothetical protein HPP92_010573 [Vanilla planifolia]